MSKLGKFEKRHSIFVKVAPLVHVKKNELSFSFYCDMATHLAPPDSVMDHKSFKIEVFITKVQLEQGVLPCSNLQVKCWEGEFPCIPMRDLSHS